LFAKWFNEADGTVADKIETIFLEVEKSARHPKWKGCGFLRTVAELANLPGHPAMKIGAAHKKKFESWLAQEFASRGIAGASHLARQITVLMDGAFSTMLVHRDPSYAGIAGVTARNLIESALVKSGQKAVLQNRNRGPSFADDRF
jgi:hypothetical protein